LHTIDSVSLAKIVQKVANISTSFLSPLDISFFQFKRTFSNGSFIILANQEEYFKELFDEHSIETNMLCQPEARKRHYCFWDEALSQLNLSYLTSMGIYHGFTIINRGKNSYDCISFALTRTHPFPVVFYLQFLNELQNFSDTFPIKARYLIKEVTSLFEDSKIIDKKLKEKVYFLPKRSTRYYMINNNTKYITTYEAICVQLHQEGKSYKEISNLLSSEPSTVKTHLRRLKARCELSLREINLQSYTIKKTGN
jgi:DNA-binding CsgD family transcriptional regulator